MEATTLRNIDLVFKSIIRFFMRWLRRPEAGIVGAVGHVEDGGHVDCGGCLHLLEQGLQVSASDAMVMIIMMMVMVIRPQLSS